MSVPSTILTSATRRKLERLDKLAATILDNLKRLAIPGTVIELRVPDLERSVDGSKYTLTRCYHYDNLQALAEEAARYEGKANIYFTLNPVWEELVGAGVPADDDYITSRQYIYVDVDPVRYDASGEKMSTEWQPSQHGFSASFDKAVSREVIVFSAVNRLLFRRLLRPALISEQFCHVHLPSNLSEQADHFLRPQFPPSYPHLCSNVLRQRPILGRDLVREIVP